MDEIAIEAKEISMVDVSSINPDPKNPNKHPPEQLVLLQKMILDKGFRDPIVVSKRSGLIVCGHARFEVAKELNMREIPVIYQDFETREAEYEHMQADNELGKLATTDLSMVNIEIQELGPDINVELMGFRDFVIEPLEKFNPPTPDYGILDNSGLDVASINSGVKKAVLIEFEKEDYEEAFAEIKHWRSEKLYIGAFLIEKLRELREDS